MFKLARSYDILIYLLVISSCIGTNLTDFVQRSYPDLKNSKLRYYSDEHDKMKTGNGPFKLRSLSSGLYLTFQETDFSAQWLDYIHNDDAQCFDFIDLEGHFYGVMTEKGDQRFFLNKGSSKEGSSSLSFSPNQDISLKITLQRIGMLNSYLIKIGNIDSWIFLKKTGIKWNSFIGDCSSKDSIFVLENC